MGNFVQPATLHWPTLAEGDITRPSYPGYGGQTCTMIPEGTVPSADPGPACKEFSGTIRKAIYLDAPAPPATGMPGPGAFLAMPITPLLAAMFGTFP